MGLLGSQPARLWFQRWDKRISWIKSMCKGGPIQRGTNMSSGEGGYWPLEKLGRGTYYRGVYFVLK